MFSYQKLLQTLNLWRQTELFTSYFVGLEKLKHSHFLVVAANQFAYFKIVAHSIIKYNFKPPIQYFENKIREKPNRANKKRKL